MGRLKHYTFEQLRFAILECNTTILQEPLIRQFSNLIPTAEEKGLLSTLDLSETIAKAELFFIEVTFSPFHLLDMEKMLKIHRYEARLKGIHLYLMFDERFSELDRVSTCLMRFNC